MSHQLSDSSDSPDSPDSSPPRSTPQSLAEWISFSIASAIVLAILSAVGYLWMTDRNQDPPTLTVSSQLEPRQGQYYVPFTVTNSGGKTAESVQVIAELRVEGVLVEWGDQQIDFLSRKEEAEGAFIFVRDPQLGELSVRVASYKLP